MRGFTVGGTDFDPGLLQQVTRRTKLSKPKKAKLDVALRARALVIGESELAVRAVELIGDRASSGQSALASKKVGKNASANRVKANGTSTRPTPTVDELTLRRMAGLSARDWRGLVRSIYGRGAKFPDEVEGRTLSEKRDDLTRRIVERIARERPQDVMGLRRHSVFSKGGPGSDLVGPIHA